MSAPQPIPKGKLVSFKPLVEAWSEYSISDGTVFRVKVVVTKIYRQMNPDGAPMFLPDGSPAYFFMSTNVSQGLTGKEHDELREQEGKIS